MTKNRCYQYIKTKGGGFVECMPEMILDGGESALELVAACGENKTERLLISADNLPDDFFDLHTGLAGEILLKLSNYYIILAAVIPRSRIGNGRFYEMVCETNRGREFRVFQSRSEAVNWLSSF